MTQRGYSITTEGAVALGAGVAKSILGVKAGAAFGVQLKSFEVDFDGVTASAVPVLVEVCGATFATNAPGTASTTVTEIQLYGRVGADGCSSAKTWTTEPTVLTVLKSFLLTPNGGLVMYQWPLGQEPDCALGEGFAIRCNAPAAVNVRGCLAFEPA